MPAPPLFLQIIRTSLFNIQLHPVQRIQFQRFIQCINILELIHGCQSGFDQNIHPKLQLIKPAVVKCSVFYRIFLGIRMDSAFPDRVGSFEKKPRKFNRIT